MKKKKVIALMLVAAVMGTLLIGCGSGGEEAAAPAETPQEKIVLKLGHTGAPDHPYQKAAEMFAQEVSEKTDGMVEIQIFPADGLGKQQELVEGAQLGTVDMVLTSDVLLSGFEPKLGALNLPFLFEDYDHVQKALYGEAGDELSAALLEKNLKVIGWWENGFRHISNSKRIIENPADLEGLKIRTPSGTVFVDAFNMLGASATPMSFGELYSALQLGTVDGQENPTTHVLTQKFYEVQDFLSLTYHIHVSEPLIMSKAAYDKLPAEYQTILLDAGKVASEWSFKTAQETEASEIEQIKETGMTVTVPNVEAFKEATQVVYDKYEGQFGKDFIEKLRNSGK